MPVILAEDIADKKEKLLQYAVELFAEHGFDGTSVRMIADKAGMNVAMISYYYGSKEKMFEEMITQKTAYMRATLHTLTSDKTKDAWEKFQVLIDHYVERLMSSKAHFHRIMMRELSLQKRTAITKMIEERLMHNMKAVHGIIQDGVKKKIFRKDVDYGFIISTLIGTITHNCSYSSLVSGILKINGGVNKLSPEEHQAWLKDHLKELFACYMLESNYKTKASRSRSGGSLHDLKSKKKKHK
ncbi:MAG TPA: TetR family transcriptional regulator [Bacteroidia bacterium]|jgi:AcrR family transcriptional regulator|nr:TetR family transcriptional regulator [Bacteroidia bacterium]